MAIAWCVTEGPRTASWFRRAGSWYAARPECGPGTDIGAVASAVLQMSKRHVLLLAAVVVAGACARSTEPAATTTSSPPPETPTPTQVTPTAAPVVTSTPPDVVAPPETTLPPGPATTRIATSVTERISITVAGRERHYTLYLPSTLATPAPLVIDFHGLTATPEREERVSTMRRKADATGFVVAQPAADLVGNAWDTLEGSGDVAFAVAVVEDVAARTQLDRSRVFAVGYSAGGGMAARLACDAADVFAAVGVVAGAHLGWGRCRPTRPVPLISFHGDADLIVPFDGFGLIPDIAEWSGFHADLNGCGAPPNIREETPDVRITQWSSCDAGADVVLYTVVGGGHGWPGTTDPSRVGDTTDSVSATDLIWDFFRLHAMP